MGDLCFRALRGLAEAFPGTVLLFSCSLCSILHPFPPHTVTVILHTKFLLCVCFWKTSLRQGAYRNDLQAIMSSPSFSLNMSQQIVQPAKSSGGVNDGKHDIYVSPCLLPGSTGLALGSPIFPSGCEGKLGVALESLQGLRDLT